MRDAAQIVATERTEHRIPPAEGREGPLGLLQVRPVDGACRPTPVILLHGATFGSAMFDISVPGYSFQDFLAAGGWNNFALDVRGYGRSGLCPVLDAPPEENEPYARLAAAVDDLETGVKFVLKQTGAKKANIVSFSWGTVVASVFATRSPRLVAKLVLYAPLYAESNELWIGRLADPNNPGRIKPGMGSYRWVGETDIRARWDADLPDGAKPEEYREQRVMHAIVEALSAADSWAGKRPKRSFRAPTGALVDLFEVFTGKPLYNPKRIKAPTLIIRGADDTTSTHSDAQGLFHALGTSDKRYVAISPGSHFLCAELNAKDLFGEIDLFLGCRP